MFMGGRSGQALASQQALVLGDHPCASVWREPPVAMPVPGSTIVVWKGEPSQVQSTGLLRKGWAGSRAGLVWLG